MIEITLLSDRLHYFTSLFILCLNKGVDVSLPDKSSPKINWKKLGIFIGAVIIASLFFIIIRNFYPKSSVENYVAGNEEFSLDFREAFTDKFDGPHIFIFVSTVGKFPCSAFQNEFHKEGRYIQIKFGSITKQEMCLMPGGNASFTRDLNIREGKNTLEIISKGKKNIYSINLTDKEIQIISKKTEFSVYYQNSIQRLPKNLLWANCFYNGNSDFDPHDDHCRNFFRLLEQITRPYKIAEAGKTPRNQFYLYDGADQPLLELIHQFDREHFYITISTWQGKIFICPTNCTMPGVAYVPNLEIEYIPEAKMNVSECLTNNYLNEGTKIQCLMEVAKNSKNELVCEQIPFENRDDCYAKVGIAKLDENLCANFTKCFSCQENCLSYLAVQKNNPDICEMMNSIYRDDCYIEYADANNDITYCDKVQQQGRVEWCLDNFK